jgi:hypothetical protein
MLRRVTLEQAADIRLKQQVASNDFHIVHFWVRNCLNYQKNIYFVPFLRKFLKKSVVPSFLPEKKWKIIRGFRRNGQEIKNHAD